MTAELTTATMPAPAEGEGRPSSEGYGPSQGDCAPGDAGGDNVSGALRRIAPTRPEPPVMRQATKKEITAAVRRAKAAYLYGPPCQACEGAGELLFPLADSKDLIDCPRCEGRGYLLPSQGVPK